MKGKSESEVAQSGLTLSDPMDCSLPGSSIHGFSRQEYWSGVPLLLVSIKACYLPIMPSYISLIIGNPEHSFLVYWLSFFFFCGLFIHILCLVFAWIYGSSSEKAMAPNSSTLAWKISWTEEPGRLQSLVSLKVGDDWETSFSLFTFMHWRRKWQPTPVFLPGGSQGRRSLVGCRLWGRTESDTTEVT